MLPTEKVTCEGEVASLEPDIPEENSAWLIRRDRADEYDFAVSEAWIEMIHQRRIRLYPVIFEDHHRNGEMEILIWDDYWRYYSFTRISLDEWLTEHSIPKDSKIRWYDIDSRLRLRPGRKPQYLRLYIDTNRFCIMEKAYVRDVERARQSIFHYRE